jgi:hypothetical protein
MLSDAAARRLVHYCRRVPLTEPEFVDEHGRQLRYVGGALREVVWRDVEVRDALLAAEDRGVWAALLEDLWRVGMGDQGLSLLDLASAMSLHCLTAQTAGTPR